jgi:hypothetical protein
MPVRCTADSIPISNGAKGCKQLDRSCDTIIIGPRSSRVLCLLYAMTRRRPSAGSLDVKPPTRDWWAQLASRIPGKFDSFSSARPSTRIDRLAVGNVGDIASGTARALRGAPFGKRYNLVSCVGSGVYARSKGREGCGDQAPPLGYVAGAIPGSCGRRARGLQCSDRSTSWASERFNFHAFTTLFEHRMLIFLSNFRPVTLEVAG